MENDDATILALALGIPSATLLSIALLLAFRFQYRPLQRREVLTPTVPTNSPAPSDPVDPYYGIPLEQRPPRIVAPLPHRPILIDNFTRIARSEEGGIPESISPVIPERRPPTPPRRRTPIVVVSPTTSAKDPPYAPRSPSPGEYAHYRENGRGFDVGHDI